MYEDNIRSKNQSVNETYHSVDVKTKPVSNPNFTKVSNYSKINLKVKRNLCIATNTSLNRKKEIRNLLNKSTNDNYSNMHTMEIKNASGSNTSNSKSIKNAQNCINAKNSYNSINSSLKFSDNMYKRKFIPTTKPNESPQFVKNPRQLNSSLADYSASKNLKDKAKINSSKLNDIYFSFPTTTKTRKVNQPFTLSKINKNKRIQSRQFQTISKNCLQNSSNNSLKNQKIKKKPYARNNPYFHSINDFNNSSFYSIDSSSKISSKTSKRYCKKLL